MDHGSDRHTFWYSWGAGRSNRFAATIDSNLSYPHEASIGEFITEHYWGYSQGPKHTFEYQVHASPNGNVAKQMILKSRSILPKPTGNNLAF